MKHAGRTAYITPSQKRALIKIMSREENRNLITGTFSNAFTRKDAQRRWECLAFRLNAIPGARKQWYQWRKTWQDLKTKCRRAARQRYSNNGVARGSSEDPLSTESDFILKSLTSTIAEEPDIEFDFKQETNIEVIEEDVEKTIVDVKQEMISNSVEETEDVIIKQEIDYSATNETGEQGNEYSCPTTIRDMETGRKWQPRATIRRIERPALASERLAKLGEERNKIKEHYYEKKLELLQKQLKIQERAATARERIAVALERYLELKQQTNNFYS